MQLRSLSFRSKKTTDSSKTEEKNMKILRKLTIFLNFIERLLRQDPFVNDLNKFVTQFRMQEKIFVFTL